jgi:hypothetical protein
VSVKNLQNENHSELRKPSADEFWTMLQRSITFEEPSSRWARLRKAMIKSAEKSLSHKALAKLNPVEQDYLFASLYGATNPQFVQINRAFNLILALRDLAKFQKITFEMWSAGIKNFYEQARQQDFGELSAIAQAIATRDRLSPAQRLWLLHSAIAVPDWQSLCAAGPWSNDVRARSISHTLASFPPDQSAKPHSVPEFLLMMDALTEAFVEQERVLRPLLPASFLPSRILLVEGPTEQIVIPHLAQCLNLNFSERGIMLVPAGGANQVMRRYLNFREVVAIPIDCVLDGDVAGHADSISEHLRDQDHLYTLSSGEIEEVFSHEQLTQIANCYLETHKEGSIQSVILDSEWADNVSKKEALERLWRKRGLGPFDKIGFAHAVAKSIRRPAQVPAEMKEIIERIASA